MFSPTCALYNTRFEQASPNIATTSSVNTFFVICFPELPFLSAYSLGISSCKPCFPQLFLEWHTVICDVIFPKYFSLGCLFFDKCFFGQKKHFSLTYFVVSELRFSPLHVLGCLVTGPHLWCNSSLCYARLLFLPSWGPYLCLTFKKSCLLCCDCNVA